MSILAALDMQIRGNAEFQNHYDDKKLFTTKAKKSNIKLYEKNKGVQVVEIIFFELIGI